MFFFKPGNQAVQWICDRKIHKGHGDIDLDPLPWLEFWFGGLFRRLDGALRLIKRRGGDQGAHSNSADAETNPNSSCHHRVACLRRDARAVTAGSEVRTLTLFYHP